LIKFLAAFLLLFFCGFASASVAQNPCIIDDEEEYAVLAAILFPDQADAPDRFESDLERKAYLALATVSLDGFHGSSYTLQNETIRVNTSRGTDRLMIDDYNKKNSLSCKIEGVKLLARVPKGKDVTLISAEEIKKLFFPGPGESGGWEGFRKRRPMTGGITYLSRPGFNGSRTEAMVEARHQADYEMGVGYRVYLQKSPKNGKWIIIGADLTRRS
jgi:hypothetical protein